MTDIHAKDNRRQAPIERYIAQMPSLSTTVMKVLEVCDDPGSSPNDLSRVISLDPVLVGKVLKLINSAYYSLRSRVTSMTRAIILLGLNTVKNLALSTAILETLSGKRTAGALSTDAFWTHCLCTGVTAKAIAAHRGVPLADREEYFVAGLLHDLGKIPMSRLFPDDYEIVLMLVRAEEIPITAAEERILGIDHRQVGTMIARKWQLNDRISRSLRDHHDSPGFREEDHQLSVVVALANLFANHYGIGSAGDVLAPPDLRESLLDCLGMSWSDLDALHETVLDNIEAAKIFLMVSKKR
ncbi:MAG: HDOD domain-containing protein [Deltaproteobacteria bacterium]|nr:HDOD domain-containing protein [Deltaproteobacteria bacterium]